MPDPSEKLCGGHCVRLVGYTDNGINGIPAQHFIGANSWGTDWGLAGYFAIPMHTSPTRTCRTISGW